MKKSGLIICLIFSIFAASGQTNDNYSDELLASSFKLFKQADFELANHMLPFLKKRVIEELNDSNNFYNPYDSLSNQITIKVSSDSLVKLYCWDERNSGCRWMSETFIQFKADSNKIKTIDLEQIASDFDEDLYIFDLQRIDIKKEPHYLIMGYGGHCGNHKYQIARVYKIVEDSFIKCDSIFGMKNEIIANSNSRGRIEMKFDVEKGTLTYNNFTFLEDIGFYSDEKEIITWRLNEKGFEKVN